MPVKCAARLFGVPRSTLRDRAAGNVKRGTNPGPIPYLTNAEEQNWPWQLFSWRSKSWVWKVEGRD